MPESVVLLHGFGGTRRAWDDVIARLSGERYLALALDLPGHGQRADAGRPITFASCVDDVLARAPRRFALCGYSLGGRVALHVALAAPERVRRLVLVSTTAGIEGDAERARRRLADARLADELERAGQATRSDDDAFERFIARWSAQPLFSVDPAAVTARAREDWRRNRPDALAAALRGIGTGEMPALWGRLAELTMPAIVVAGDRDVKFQALGRRMVELLPDAELLLTCGGHRVLLENPQAVARALERGGTLD